MTDHARRSDPASSDRTVKSIVRDQTLAELIIRAAYFKEANSQLYRYDAPFCDTWLWQWIEDFTGRRHQRNVIARARGRLVDDGILEGVGPRPYEGVMLEHYKVISDPTNKGAAA